MIGVAFTERMDGRLVVVGERFDRCTRFELTAVGPSAKAMLGVAVLDVEGVVHVDGIADAAPARGTLLVSPFTQRRVVYSLSFTGTDGSPYRLDGRKTLDYTHPLRSWTTMQASLVDAGGTRVAAGVMWFRGRDLGAFVSGFRATRETGPSRIEEATA
ncbi:MAG: hypothetical protein IT198_05345 [Acidimicrobiia bacterium]|nr:hypothetical protein [Acidimicrobiia bacterium]